MFELDYTEILEQDIKTTICMDLLRLARENRNDQYMIGVKRAYSHVFSAMGIPDDNIQQIFDRLYATDQNLRMDIN